MMEDIERAIDVGDGFMLRNLTVFPLFRRDGGSFCPLRTLDEAMAAGSVALHETGQVPWVDLEVGKDGGQPVFLMDGEGLVAGMQNRVVATAVLAEAGLTHRVPVTCVEQGRWSGERAFKAGSSAYPSLRAILASSVAASLRSGRGFSADQKAVWSSVKQKLSSLRVSSATSSMHDAYSGLERAISVFTEGFRLDGASGFMAFAGDELLGLDLLPGPDVMASLREKLAESYALDAIERMSRASRFLSRDEAVATLRHLSMLRWHEFPGVSLGREKRGEDGDMIARALVHKDRLVSLSAFARAGVAG
ncbi:MAG: ARPP-1 family domain-containing protein [candidate division WOR-3 bacterium]